MTEATSGYSPADLPGELPPDNIPFDVDTDSLTHIAVDLLKHLNEDTLTEDAFWKDWVSLTGRVKTTNGQAQILQLWKRAISNKQVTDIEATSARVMRPCKGTSWVIVICKFTTTLASGLSASNTANISLIPCDDNKWRIWMLATILEHFHDHPHPDTGPSPSLPAANLFTPAGTDYAVVVLGAGQSGLSLAGRLRALHLKTLLIEKAPSVGNAWTSKYDSVRQHTLREYNNLPFERTWGPEDPDLLPGKIVAEGFARYVDRYGIEVWPNSEVTNCTRDDKKGVWVLEVTTSKAGSSSDTSEGSDRDSLSPSTPNSTTSSSSTQVRRLTCVHLAPALGAGVSFPYTPQLPDSRRFRGEIIHQSAFRAGKHYTSKHCIVVGTGTTGHDIAQSLLDANAASVTMIQRSPTAIYPIQWVVDSQSGLYNHSIPTDVADRLGATSPAKVATELIKRRFEEASHEAEYETLVKNLEGRGFRVKRDWDMLGMIWGRYGGYYIDVGTSREIAEGRIKVKSGVKVAYFSENTVGFDDGEEVRADLMVCATGYERDYRRQIAKIVGEDVMKTVGEYWGLDKDGDVRGAMGESRKGLWLLGGTAPNARWWSRANALMMLADLRGWDWGPG